MELVHFEKKYIEILKCTIEKLVNLLKHSPPVPKIRIYEHDTPDVILVLNDFT